MHRILTCGALAALFAAAPAAAQEVFAGLNAHEVDTPFTLHTGESGVDLVAGYRFGRVEALGFIGKPQPYVIVSANTAGDTSFAGAGLGWTLGKGPVYVRPAVGLVVHDGPGRRVDPVTRQHTELGSRVLFEPELGIGYRISPRLSVEANWTHVSHARLFNAQQNPGIDMIGARINLRLP